MKDVVLKGCKCRIASWAGLRTAGLEMGYKMVGWVVARTDLSFDALQADHGGKLQRWHEFTDGLASWRVGDQASANEAEEARRIAREGAKRHQRKQGPPLPLRGVGVPATAKWRVPPPTYLRYLGI